jgi:acetylornithine deacetylase
LASAPTSVDMIRRLVSFDTTSRNSNLALIHWVQDYLAEYGITSELVFDDERRKANLFATIGPEAGGIMLSGHTDVVPVDGQDWASDPFAASEREGALFGRGTADMKSFIAVALALVPEMTRRRLRRPIHLALSYDEEVGCIGARRLIAALADRRERPRLCIVGEPTLMKPVNGHKGKRSLRCTVHGFACHSALAHQGVNAVEAAAEIVAQLKRMARRHRDEGPFDAAFEPPYTTVHTGVIRGGTALNIVPSECSFDFEFRYLPKADPDALLGEVETFIRDEVLPEMREARPETRVDIAELTAFPGLATGEDEEVAQLVRQLTGANASGKVSFGTEGGLFQKAGIPTIVCGPGSIEQAHKPDEFVTLDQVRQCESFLRRLVEHAAA